MENKLKILCVDDEPINLLVMELSLKHKYEVLKAETGFDGIQTIDANPDIKVIITDMKMPGIDGVEFVRIIKRDYPEIGVIIVTGFDMNSEIEDAINENIIFKYFRKPYDLNEFEKSLAEFTALK